MTQPRHQIAATHYRSIVDISETLFDLADETAQTAAREWVKAIVATRSRKKPKGGRSELEARQELRRHIDTNVLRASIGDARGWAGFMQVQGMPRPLDTPAVTIGLEFAEVARRFRGSGRPGQILEERDLIMNSRSLLVLGDPGSGKTTTMKRLVLSVFEEVDIAADPLLMPLVIVCRKTDWSSTRLVQQVARLTGLDLEAATSSFGFSAAESAQIVASLLDKMSCLLILDGLDEVSPGLRGPILDDLVSLNRFTSHATVICSCRSGDAPHVEGFFVAELLPLTREQQRSIVGRRTDQADAFMENVASSSVDAQLLDRPLFLNHLLTVFEATGSLAQRPVDLYRQLVRLMIHEWDEQRRVRRQGKVAGLDATNVLEALRFLAFAMTEDGSARLTPDDANRLYPELAEAFGFRKSSGLALLRDIEANAGFIGETPTGFEFTHFTLQEFLCADSIVQRLPSRSVDRVLAANPEIAAVAVALSADPNEWLRQRSGRGVLPSSDEVRLFIDRLGQERPRFVARRELGTQLLQIALQASANDFEYWSRLLDHPAVKRSIKMACEPLILEPGDGDFVAVRRTTGDGRPQRGSMGRVPNWFVPT